MAAHHEGPPSREGLKILLKKDAQVDLLAGAGERQRRAGRVKEHGQKMPNKTLRDDV
jgi:hypothetical protein